MVAANILLVAAAAAAVVEAVEDVAAKVGADLFEVVRMSAVGEGSDGIAQVMAAMEHT